MPRHPFDHGRPQPAGHELLGVGGAQVGHGGGGHAAEDAGDEVVLGPVPVAPAGQCGGDAGAHERQRPAHLGPAPHEQEEGEEAVAASEGAVEVEGRDLAHLTHAGPQTLSLRNRGRGRWRMAIITKRSGEGTHTVSAPRRRPWATALATTSGVVDSGTGSMPAVILLLTNPGRTTSTCTPEPCNESPSPWAKASSPAL